LVRVAVEALEGLSNYIIRHNSIYGNITSSSHALSSLPDTSHAAQTLFLWVPLLIQTIIAYGDYLFTEVKKKSSSES
jgi:hypothetical protein